MSGVTITLALGFALAFAESGLGLGIVMPGETAVVVLAASMRSTTDMLLLGVAVMIGASMGDHVGYLLGRRYGDKLRDTKPVRRLGVRRFDSATSMLRRRGASAVFFTRLVPIVRTLTPAAAGAAGLEYRRFAPASLAGSATWAGVYVGGGSVVATVISVTTETFGPVSWLLLELLALAVVPVLIIRAVGGVRPVAAAPDVASLELAVGAHAHRSAFAPVFEDVPAF